MANKLTLDEILQSLQIDTISFHDNDLYSTRRGRALANDAKQSILQWVADELVGDSELHVSHVCPPDSVGCAKFSQRCATRNHQRQILKANGWKES